MNGAVLFRRWRGKRSQVEIALLLGRSQCHISRLESGSTKPSKELATMIAGASGGRVPVRAWGELEVRRSAAA